MKKLYFLLVATLVAFTANAQTPINTNGDLETGDATGWTLPGGGVNYTVTGDAAYSGSYGLHVSYAEGERLDALVVGGFQFEIGETYTFEMRVKALVMNQHMTLRMQPNAWSDAFKENLTLPGTGWGVPAVIGEWVHFSFTKEITTAFSAGSSIGDMIDSRIFFQNPNGTPTATEFYIDDVKVYKGSFTDIEEDSRVIVSKVFVSNNILYVKDVEAASSQVKVYNLSGVVVAEDEFVGSEYTKTLNLAKGLYIVKVGTQTTKVMVK